MPIPAVIAGAGRGIASAFGKAKSGMSAANAANPGIGGKLNLAQSGLTGMKVQDMFQKGNRMIGVPAAFFGAGFAKDVIVDPLIDSFDQNKDPYQVALRDAKLAHEENRRSMMQRIEIESMQKRTMEASMRLAALDPHLYNEVMAGRSLPKDAVVFGGQPRQDLMEELSMAMAQGQFKETSAQDELMKSLGV